jgi:tetratricopeptide (TPR) repeat protein
MNRSSICSAVSAIVIGAILCGCTAGAKKKHYAESAERAFKAGEYDKARIEYLNLLRLDPDNARAHAQLGTMWAEEGVPLRAGGFLLKAIELAPNDNVTRRKLARVYLSISRAADARKEAITLLQNAPDDGEALVILVDASQKPEELAEAEQWLGKFPQKQSAYFYLATAGVAAKKSDQAAIEPALQKAVAADPNLAIAHMALGSWYRLKREFDRAGAELERAANDAPVRSNERMSNAEFKVQMRAVEEAKSLLKNITSQAPDFLPAWSLLAKIANREKKYDDALRLVENALSRDSGNIEARIVQVESWLAKNNTKKALESLTDLDRTYPQTPIIKYALARTYLASGNGKQAMTELDEVVRLSPGFADAVLLHAELHLKNGDAQTVLEELQKMARMAPELAPANVLLAEAYQMLGRLDEAASVIEGQIKRSPQDASYPAMLGLILRQQNKLDEARKAFEKAVALAPTNSAVIEQLVDLDITNKAYGEAHRRVEQFQQKQPTSGAGSYLEGKVYVAEGKFDLAQAALFKAIELDPNETRAYDLLVPVYSRSNKLPEAVTRLNAILAKRPNDVRALLLNGLIYDRLKDTGKAREAYEKVLTLAPNSVPALNNLAYIYGEKLNDLKRASELAQKARSLAPSDPSVLDTLGWIYYRQGDYQQAANLLAQSASKNPDGSEIQYHFGMASYMMGRSEAARIALEKAVASPEDFEGKDEARQRLVMLDNQKSQNIPAEQLEALLKEKPNDPIALLRLGEAYERQGSVAKAAEVFERAFTANPRLADVAMKLAQLNVGPLKNPEKALQFAKKARELSPADPKTTATAGAIALQLKNNSWAYSLLQESAHELPKDAAVLHDLAWAAYNLGKLTEAREAMQRALDLDPTGAASKDARTFLSMMKLGDNERDLRAGETEVEKTLATDPNYLPALVARAQIQRSKGNTEAVAATYSQILRSAPDFAPAQRDLAEILIEDPQKTEEAYELANKARKSLPDDARAATVLARASYERKDFNRAIQLFEQVARQQTLDPVSLYYFGMSQGQARQTEAAKKALNEALQRGLGEPQAANARRELVVLGEK